MKWRELLDQHEWKELKKAIFELYREYKNTALTSEDIKDVWIARGAIFALRRLLTAPMQGFRSSEERVGFSDSLEKELARESEREIEEDLKNG